MGSLSGAAQIFNDSAASGGQGVAYIYQQGAGFTVVNQGLDADRVNILYASEQSGTITIKIKGQAGQDLNFDSTGSWTGNYRLASYGAKIPSGATLEIVWENGNNALNVDYLQFSASNDAPAPTPTVTPTPMLRAVIYTSKT